MWTQTPAPAGGTPARDSRGRAGLMVMLTEELGKMRMEGKDYVMQDGDVVELRSTGDRQQASVPTLGTDC